MTTLASATTKASKASVKTITVPVPSKAPAITQEQVDLLKQIEELKRENARLAGIKLDGRFKVSEKGAVSVYGCGRFPVTLYKSQWVKLLSMASDIEKFMAENESKLAVKGEKE